MIWKMDFSELEVFQKRSLTSVRIISHAARDLLHSTNNIWLEFALMIRMLLVRKWREHSLLQVDHCHGKAYRGSEKHHWENIGWGFEGST